MKPLAQTARRSLALLCAVASFALVGDAAVPSVTTAAARDQLVAFLDDGDLYVISIDGTGRRQLTNGVANDSDQAWSPDGSRLAFVRRIRVGMDRGDWVTRPVIYVVRVDGSGLRRLSPHRVADEHPAWSPDGRMITFQRSFDLENELANDIWVMNADGSGGRRLTRHPVLDRYPTWSPDGKQIAFVRGWPDRLEVFVMRADGGNQHSVLGRRMETYAPAWSPDGDRIALFGWQNKNLYTVRPDGRGLSRLAGNADVLHSHPSWSANGAEIAFGRDTDPSYIWVVRSDGRRLRRLAEGFDHGWSTRNRLIAYDTVEGTSIRISIRIYVSDPDGGGRRRLTAGKSPRWQP